MSAENQTNLERSKQESVIPGFNTDGTKRQKKPTHGYSIGYATAKAEYEAHLTPLVDLLDRVDLWFKSQRHNGALMSDVAEALAKVKEGK